MFNIGDKIIYGSEGVFVISEYVPSPLDKNDGRIFYLLRPVEVSSSSVIVAPSQGGNVLMRAVACREEALSLIDSIPLIKEIEVDKEKNRRDIYRQVMGRGRGEDYVSLIKTVFYRRREFLAQKRRLSETDTEFESRAKNCLYGELSVALGIERERVEELIKERLCKE